MEWRKKRLSVIHHCVSGYRARLWLRNWFDISVVLLGMRNFMRVQGLLLYSLWPSSTRLHRQKSSIWLQSEKKVFATFIYILRWYSYTGSWSIFLIGKFLCYASFFLSSFKFIGWGGIFFCYGHETIWTSCHTLLDAGKDCVISNMFYLFTRILAFSIIIHGRRYICTYIESICWYLYFFTIFQLETLI